jgi:hypothetical protein
MLKVFVLRPTDELLLLLSFLLFFIKMISPPNSILNT